MRIPLHPEDLPMLAKNRVELTGTVTRSGQTMKNRRLAFALAFGDEEQHKITCYAWDEVAEFLDSELLTGCRYSVIGTLQQCVWKTPSGRWQSRHSVHVVAITKVDGRARNASLCDRKLV